MPEIGCDFTQVSLRILNALITYVGYRAILAIPKTIFS